MGAECFDDLRILVLMSGPDEDFAGAGFLYPKNLVEIHGKPLMQRVLSQFAPLIDGGAKLVCTIRQAEHSRYHTGDVVKLLFPESKVVLTKQVTAGAAASALVASDFIDSNAPLLILNGDILIDSDLKQIASTFMKQRLDGGVVVFDDIHPRWSFVLCDDDGYVIEAAEKRPISKLATAGCYYFGRGDLFVDAAQSMIRKKALTGQAYYVCPAYNEMVLKGCKIRTFKIEREQYVSLAHPRDVREFDALNKGSLHENR